MLDGKIGRLFEKLKSNKYLIALLLLGLVLLLLPTRSSGDAKKETAAESAPEFDLGGEESRIEEALARTDGAGRVRLVLTLKSSAERVIAEDTETTVPGEGSSRGSESTVSAVKVSTGGSGQETVTLKYLYPEYAGALVVAEGAGSAEVRLRLTRAVASLTGLSAEKITVVKMKVS